MSGEEIKELVAAFVQQQSQINSLIDAIKIMPDVSAPVAVTVQPARVEADVVRAEKVQKLAMCMRKSNRIKVFRHTNDSDIRKYIKKFDEELKSFKPMVGITEN